MSWILLLVSALLSLPALAAEKAASPPNVLLISVDTLRADHLSCYGYHLRTSPNIDKLAAEGVRFENANTTIPLTGPSHISLLTSHYPQEHGARINGLAVSKKARVMFLPQILRRFGYRNAAFVSGWPLKSRLTHLNVWFDHYDEDMPRTYQLFNSSRYAEDVTPKALAWLRSNHHRPFFLFVHYFDPHSPYHLREEFAHPEQIRPTPKHLEGIDEETRDRIQKYDSEIGYADHYIGKLLSTLDELNLRQSTLVVLLADHGESLGEHDYVGHGRHLYQNIIRVPLIFRLPGVTRPGKVIQEDVSLLDVTPTILGLTVDRGKQKLDMPLPMDGRNLAAALDGGAGPDEQTVRYVTFSGKKGLLPRVLTTWLATRWLMRSLPLKMGQTTGDRKVIWTPGDNRLEIFDISRDPLELKPSTPDRKTPVYKAETARLERWFKSTAGEEGENQMTERDIEILKSLGYLH